MRKDIVPHLLVFCLSTCFCFCSCEKLVTYNANEVRVDEKDKDQNIKNIQRLQSQSQSQNGSFQFAVISDSQRAYDELDAFVQKANNIPGLSFVVLNGDITDFGLNSEYNWISQQLQKLRMPFIVVIGNHDMLGNGREIYRQMFGPENFAFSFSNYRFIVLNSNSREAGFDGSLPDLSWLQGELSATPPTREIIVVAHLAPFSGDFDPSLEKVYAKTLADNGRVIYSIHGHEDIYYLDQPYGPPVNYLVVNSVREKSFALVNVNKDSINVEQIHF